jgi:hypothetical protein
MTWTIKAAMWGNEDHTSAVLVSEEVGRVAVSEVDTPQEWAAFLQWVSYGHPVADLPVPKPREPLSIEQKLARLGITREELKAHLGI